VLLDSSSNVKLVARRSIRILKADNLEERSTSFCHNDWHQIVVQKLAMWFFLGPLRRNSVTVTPFMFQNTIRACGDARSFLGFSDESRHDS
jgi:hypothetical protein